MRFIRFVLAALAAAILAAPLAQADTVYVANSGGTTVSVVARAAPLDRGRERVQHADHAGLRLDRRGRNGVRRAVAHAREEQPWTFA